MAVAAAAVAAVESVAVKMASALNALSVRATARGRSVLLAGCVVLGVV